MTKIVRPSTVGSVHAAAAWLFLVGAIISGIVGVYRGMSSGAVAGNAVTATLAQPGAECMCLGVLLGIIAAVLALLGIHRQMAVALSVVPTLQGSHGSGDGDGDT